MKAIIIIMDMVEVEGMEMEMVFLIGERILGKNGKIEVN